jgi:hypothetical protein
LATAAGGGAAVVCKARTAAAHHVMPLPQSPPYTAETAAAKKKELAGSSAGDRCAAAAAAAAAHRPCAAGYSGCKLESNSVDFKVRWGKERAAAWELFRHKLNLSATCCYCHAIRLIVLVRYFFFYHGLTA